MRGSDSNEGRQFAIVKWDERRKCYPFLKTDGTFHHQQYVTHHTGPVPAPKTIPQKKRDVRA